MSTCQESEVLNLFSPHVSSCVQVDIRFPQPGSNEPDKVTVTGLPDTVDSAIDHLLNLEEEYVSLVPTHTVVPVVSVQKRAATRCFS